MLTPRALGCHLGAGTDMSSQDLDQGQQTFHSLSCTEKRIVGSLSVAGTSETSMLQDLYGYSRLVDWNEIDPHHE